MQHRGDQQSLQRHRQHHGQREPQDEPVHYAVGIPADDHERQVDERNHRHGDRGNEHCGGEDDHQKSREHGGDLHESRKQLVAYLQAELAVRREELVEAGHPAEPGRALLTRRVVGRHVRGRREAGVGHVFAEELAERPPSLADVENEQLRLAFLRLLVLELRLHVGIVPPKAGPRGRLVERLALQPRGAERGGPSEAQHFAKLEVRRHEHGLKLAPDGAVAQRGARDVFVHGHLRLVHRLPPSVFLPNRQDHLRVRVDLKDVLPEAKRRHAHDDF
mmetsp:Transcript_41198/g.113643  ORF Transcript_41198/g.113643 Transcript_41198/m.113643 type:complete len:276 (+) Transcript_41198:1151-1978(+)